MTLHRVRKCMNARQVLSAKNAYCVIFDVFVSVRTEQRPMLRSSVEFLVAFPTGPNNRRRSEHVPRASTTRAATSPRRRREHNRGCFSMVGVRQANKKVVWKRSDKERAFTSMVFNRVTDILFAPQLRLPFSSLSVLLEA